jgi:hypothetical protein
MNPSRLVGPLVSVFVVVGCGAKGSDPEAPPEVEAVDASYLASPGGPLPETMAELGLYPKPGDLGRVHPRALPYEPAYPLWSNGSEKQRFLVLPDGAGVDASESDAWSFPLGTLFLKTFSYPPPGDASGKLRPLETRVIRSGEDGFEYAVYLWDEAGESASLIDLKNKTLVPVELDGEAFEHEVPSKLQCRMCHESKLGTIIGFREIQLGALPASGGETELEKLARRSVFTSELAAEPERIEHDDPLTLEVLGYLQGNCVHCHNGGEGSSTAFDMRHDVALENLISRDSEGELLSGIRVVPGDPEASLVYLTLDRRSEEGEILPMPPVGVQREDARALELFRSWIEALPAEGTGE